MERYKKEINMTPQEKLLTPRDVAGILGCTPDRVIQLARSGQIRVAHPGRFWRFHHRDVMEYRNQVAGSPDK
jgi:excisionase family DNA binding protein